MLNLAFFLFFLFVSKGFFFLFTDGRLSRFSWRRTGRGGLARAAEIRPLQRGRCVNRSRGRLKN